MPNHPFAGRVRVRVNGLLVRNHSLLLVKMKSRTRSGPFWIPPGGGVDFGESLEEALIREMYEETGLNIKILHLRYVSEYINLPWHAVEFYFDVETDNFEVRLGSDPELDGEHQMLQDIQLMPFQEFGNYKIVPEYLKERFARDFLSGRHEPMFIKAGYELR